MRFLFVVHKNEEKAEQNSVLFHRLTLKERRLCPNGYFPLMRQPLFLPAGERKGQEDLEDWVKVRIGNAVFVAHIWRSQMSTASRGTFVVVPKISHSDTFMHNKKAESR